MAYAQQQAHARVDVERAHRDAPREPAQRRLRAEREVVHDDGARRGHGKQRAVVGERQGVDGIRIGVRQQRLDDFRRGRSRGGVLDHVHRAPHGEDEGALVFYGEATNVI